MGFVTIYAGDINRTAYMRYFYVTDFTRDPDDMSTWSIDEVQEDEADASNYSGDGFIHEVDDVTSDPLMIAQGVKPITKEGEEPGERCGQFLEHSNTRCPGILEEKDIEGCCNCHMGFAPCGYCTAGRVECLECGWEQENA
jgi:hypothetical protein